MSFDPIKPLGWGYLEILTSGQISQVAHDVALAMDSRGGSYAPTEQLILAGAGLRLNGANHALGGTLTVLSGGFVGIASGATLQTSSGSSSIFGGNVAHHGNVTFDTGSVSFGNGLSVTGLGTFTNLQTGGLSASEPLLRSSHAYMNDRQIDGANADAVYSPSDGDYIFVDAAGVLTGPHTYTLTKTGIAPGAVMEIINLSTHKITVQDEGGGTVGVVSSSPAVGEYYWLKTRRFGGSVDGWFACGGQQRKV